jgi:dUTP pyrophosphatase
MQLKIKRLHPDAVIPKYATSGSSGFDLYAIEDVIVKPGETVKVRTGLSFAIPHGYEIQVRPRSGVSANTKLRVSNTPGTIDADYRGELIVLIDNINQRTDSKTTEYQTISGESIETEKEWVCGGFYGNEIFESHKKVPYGTYIIRKGDRIAQAILCPIVRAEIVEVDELDDTERGAGGFGSTGVR